jgi:hypothetical protein
MTAKSKFVSLTVAASLFVACTSGPAFTEAPQTNAASLEGPVVPTQGAENGNCSIKIVQIDGLQSDFAASHEGLNWREFDKVKPLLLAPTKHKLELNISYAEAAGGGPRRLSPQGTGDEGTIGGVGELKASTVAEIFASFEVGHVYRFTADFKDDAINVVLWDETEGAQARARIADWSFNSPRTHAGGTGPNDHFM